MYSACPIQLFHTPSCAENFESIMDPTASLQIPRSSIYPQNRNSLHIAHTHHLQCHTFWSVFSTSQKDVCPLTGPPLEFWGPKVDPNRHYIKTNGRSPYLNQPLVLAPRADRVHIPRAESEFVCGAISLYLYIAQGQRRECLATSER